MFIIIAVLFAVVLSLADGQLTEGTIFCQAMLIKRIFAAEKIYDNVCAQSDYSYTKVNPGNCKMRCRMDLTAKQDDNKRFSNTEFHGPYTAPNFTRCGAGSISNYCINGECIGNEFCSEMLKKEIDEIIDKKGVYPKVEPAYDRTDKRFCELFCKMSVDNDTLTKKFIAPDYLNCGWDFKPRVLPNMCKAGKCQRIDGKTPQNPQHVFLYI